MVTFARLCFASELREQAAEQATALTQGLRLRSQDVIGESKPNA